MTRPILLVLAFAMLGGCADYGLGTIGNRYPGNNRYPDNRRVDNRRYDTRDDYSRTSEYRRITGDASTYARTLDSQLRIGNGQERQIRDLLTDRTARLLQQTRARDHSRVYPFPRRFGDQDRNSRAFWNGADRDIERILGRQDADVYRRYVRNGGRYDTRNDDRYGNDRRGNNGRANGRGRNDRDRRYDDRRGRDDGERGRADRNDDRRDDDRRGNDRTDRNDNDRRPGESLEDWYRRQSRNPR